MYSLLYTTSSGSLSIVPYCVTDVVSDAVPQVRVNDPVWYSSDGFSVTETVSMSPYSPSAGLTSIHSGSSPIVHFPLLVTVRVLVDS